MATVNEVKLMNNGEMVTPVTLAGSLKHLDGTSVFNNDGNLDMNGKNIINAIMNIATHMTVGSEGNPYGGYQITTAEQLDDFNETGKVKWAKVTQDASPFGNDGIVLSIGWRKDATRGYCRQLFFDEANHNIYSRGQSNGVWREWLPIVGNISSAINAMGDGYIRYENGLQICWGEVVWEGKIPTSWSGSGMYVGSVYVDKNFPQPFDSKARVIPNISGADQQVVLNRLAKDTTKITQITLASGTSYAEPIRAWIDYVAIGKWK